MEWNAKTKTSFVSIIVNIALSGSKLLVGFVAGSAALVADGIHSGLDVLSSVVAFLGIRVAARESDARHPYGFQVVENLAGLGVVLLLAISGAWIAWEGVVQIMEQGAVKLGVSGFAVVGVSVVANEIMARYKIKIGERENSLALISDGKHSRADVISSLGVLAGLLVIRVFPMADGIIAFLIGLYVLYESFGMGKETTDQLIGVNDEAVEAKIKEFLAEKKIEIADLKTRKLGSASFAEITVKLDPGLKVEEAERITKKLQSELLDRLERLDYVVIQVASHDYAQGSYRAGFGRVRGWQRGWQKEAKELAIPDKQGYRIMVPVSQGKLYPEFGAPEYLLLDKRGGRVVQEKTVFNPYFDQEKGRGMRVLKAIGPDELVTVFIGAGARENAEKLGVKITMVQKGFELAELKK